MLEYGWQLGALGLVAGLVLGLGAAAWYAARDLDREDERMMRGDDPLDRVG